MALGPSRSLLWPAQLPWFVTFLVLGRLWLVHRDRLDTPGVLLGGALLLRLIFFLSLPDLSDDLYRYVWDGVVTLDGIRPYAVPPADPSLRHLHDLELFREMNSPGYVSIYPPLSQWVFLAGGWAWGLAGWPAAAWVVKTGFLVMESIGVVLLYHALRRLGRRPSALALYAWNPLPLLVVAGGGHTEGGLVLGIGVLLYGLSRCPAPRGTWLVWGGWALAVLSKGIPLLLAPLLWRAVRQRRRRSDRFEDFVLPLLVVAGMALVSLPFLRPRDLAGIAGSAGLYVGLFEFNAGLYYLFGEILPLLPGPDPTPWLGALFHFAFLAGAAWLGFRHPVGSARDAARGALLVFSLYLVLSPTVHPWYLLWVLPLVPFTRTLRAPWLWGSAMAFPTYLTYTGVSHGLLAGLFWGGWFVLALNDRREWILRPLRHVAARRKARWIAPWITGDRGLDVGGGEGWVAARLAGDGAPRSRRIWVLDPMDGWKGGPPRIRARGERLPLADDSVDTVLLSFVLHHAADPDAVLGEAIRVARTRVVILESTPSPGFRTWIVQGLDRWVNAGRGDGSMEGSRSPIRYRDGAGWARAAERSGARILLQDRPSRVGHPVTRLVLAV